MRICNAYSSNLSSFNYRMTIFISRELLMTLFRPLHVDRTNFIFSLEADFLIFNLFIQSSLIRNKIFYGLFNVFIILKQILISQTLPQATKTFSCFQTPSASSALSLPGNVRISLLQTS